MLSRIDKKGVIRFIKFGIVGTSGIVVNMGILWFLTEMMGLHYLMSSVAAILLSILNNFFWNDIWTWRDSRKPGAKAYVIRLMKFFLVSSLAGYIGNWSVLWALTHFLGFHYMIANLFGIAAATALNFTLNHIWTFKT